MERVFIEVWLEDGRFTVWSSGRGELKINADSWAEVFTAGLDPGGAPLARVMFNFVGDSDLVTDNQRERLIEEARSARFGVVRLESGAPLDPELAFELMGMPFT